MKNLLPISWLSLDNIKSLQRTSFALAFLVLIELLHFCLSAETYSKHHQAIFCLVAIFLLLRHYGIHLLDETKHISNLYTRIHGQWYDLSEFQHPGGPIAIKLAKDRDSTALFESHHLLSKFDIQKLLSKYKVNDEIAKTLTTIDFDDDGGHYIWKGFHDDAFVKDVKELLYCYLSPIAKRNKCTVYQAAKASSERWLLLGILSWAFVSILPFYLDGCYWTLFVMPLVAWLLVANFWHDCLHFSFSKDWRINATLPYLLPILSSPWLWYHQHVIGHHTYTNVGMKDPDLAHAPQLKREHASIKWKKCHRNQGSYFRFVLVWSIASCIGINILNDIKTNIKLSYNNVVGYQKLSISRFYFHLFGRVVYAFITILWPLFQFSLWKAAFWIVIPNVVFSCLFMINTQINHLTEECCNSSDTNFLKHQVVTAQNFGIGTVWNFFLSGGLNYQIEHHLFPFVNHCHLPNLASGVKEICAKHGVRYQEVDGYKMAFIQHLQHTIELSKDPSILTKKEM